MEVSDVLPHDLGPCVYNLRQCIGNVAPFLSGRIFLDAKGSNAATLGHTMFAQADGVYVVRVKGMGVSITCPKQIRTAVPETGLEGRDK